MNLTLEQARTLDAVARYGSYAKAATSLNKVHSAIVYSLKSLEDAAGVALLDRSGYRAVLTPVGERVLELCRRLLETEEDLAAVCRGAREGFESFLKVVYDALYPAEALLRAARAVSDISPTTQVSLFSEFLQDVHARYDHERADVMISLLPPSESFHTLVPLEPIPSLLVVHHSHPLARSRNKLALADLARHTFLTVRGSDQRLGMSTAFLERSGVFHLSDFHAKKAALLLGMGYGWMPEYLIEKELSNKELLVLKWGEGAGRHVFAPVLYARASSAGGRACQALLGALAKE